jgi:NAD(P)-dependent dehydrogenase (short-subunit alcohol dehydrogenase family)
MGRLDGKVALITGGARGMGKSHARHFVAQGAKVVLGDILDDKGKELAAELGEDNCRYIHQDVTSESDWAAAVVATTDAFGTLNVLVNNAGILMNKKIADMTLADFRRVIDVNLIGEWLGVKNVIDPMTKAGGGSIINISSVASIRHLGISYVSYGTSKAAMNQMTRTSAVEFAAQHVRVNTILPGLMKTPMVEHSAGLAASYSKGDVEAMWRARDAQVPMGHMGEAWDVANAALFLASDESKYITGIELVVDGGITCKAG